MKNPYKIDGPALISFSGGRTSGYMLHEIINAHDGKLPDDVLVTFANTGKEREETLRFVHDCATHWGVNVRWLEWKARKGEIADRFEEVGYNSASRNGEPFARLIGEKKFLPNAVTRYCTIELKIRTMKFFAQSLGWTHWSNVIGLRADEMHRVNRARVSDKKERWTNCLPLADAGVTNRMVREFWSQQPFDLQLLPFEGNCDACFLKARPKLFEVERERPGTLNWWIQQENRMTEIAKKGAGQFRKEYTYTELQSAVRRSPDLFLGAFDGDEELDAECGTWCGDN
jgi:3'-phosphoadenosine 5'-phosphosulfate sulfotransferase (PAPS reductase)/FAD synthetase